MHVRRPELVLAGAVAICLPMASGVIHGNITPITAGTRFLIAVVICWFAGSLLTAIIDRYARESRRSQALRMLAASRQPSSERDDAQPTANPVAETRP